jgi:uncharacterized protein
MSAGALGRRSSETVVALSQHPSARLGEIAEALAAPLSSVQRAAAALAADGVVVATGLRNPAYEMNAMHPASAAMVELSLRILPVERAMDVVARSNPAVEFAGRDAAGYILVLSPFAEPAHPARLEEALARINRARPDAVPFEVVERDDLRERLREDDDLRARGLRMVVVRGSAQRAFRDPGRHGSLDAPPLHGLHPSLPRLSPALLRDLADRYRLARLTAFGSAVREDFRPDSDIDVMFEPRAGVKLGVAPRMEIQQRLERALGRDVDLVNERAVTDTVRRRVGREGVVLYG